MKITLLSVGKLKEKYLKDGIAEYAKRLSRFCDFEMIEVADEQAPENLSRAQELQVMAKEADRLLEKVKVGTVKILLDVSGEKPDSEGLSRKMDDFMQRGASHLVFIIGGSLGVDQRLRESSGCAGHFAGARAVHFPARAKARGADAVRPHPWRTD